MAIIPGSDVLRSVVEYCSMGHSSALHHPCLIGLIPPSLDLCLILQPFHKAGKFCWTPIYLLGTPYLSKLSELHSLESCWPFPHILLLVYWSSLLNGPLPWNTAPFFTTCSHSLGFRCSCHLLPWCNAQLPILNFASLRHGVPPATIFMYKWFKGGLNCHLFVCDIPSYKTLNALIRVIQKKTEPVQLSRDICEKIS